MISEGETLYCVSQIKENRIKFLDIKKFIKKYRTRNDKVKKFKIKHPQVSVYEFYVGLWNDNFTPNDNQKITAN